MADPDFRPVDDEPAPGMFDGKITSYTPEQALVLRAQRDAEDEAFGDTAEPGGEESLELDLDAMNESELDDLIAGLESETDTE